MLAGPDGYVGTVVLPVCAWTASTVSASNFKASKGPVPGGPGPHRP